MSRSDIYTLIGAVLFMGTMIYLSEKYKHTSTPVSDKLTQMQYYKDSLEAELYKQQLLSYPVNHSKIPTDGSNTKVQSTR